MPLFDLDDVAPDTTEHINLFLMAGEQPATQGELVPRENILSRLQVPLRMCYPIKQSRGYHLSDETVGWHIPQAQGLVLRAGLAIWLRVVLPGAILVDCPLRDIEMEQMVVEFGQWLTVWNVSVRYPPQQVIRLEKKQ